MYRLILSAIFCCMLPTIMKAQSSIDQMPKKFSYGRKHLKIDDIQGSPYLESEFKIGTVLTDNDMLYRDIPLRYNCFYDVIEIQKNGFSYELKPKTKVKRAVFAGQVFSYRDYESGRGIAKSYFELLVEGKASLCARFSVKFYEAEPLKGFADPKPARFDNFTETYYISSGNSAARKIISKKKLVELLADKKNEVESFIAKQKLTVNKGDDLKKIVTYYNSL